MFPVLFHLGSFAVPAFGALVLTGVFVGLWLQKREAARLGFDPRKVEELALITMLLAWFGARALYVLQNWQEIRAAGATAFGTEGYVMYGGFLVAIPSAYLLGRRAGLTGGRLVDIFTPGVILGNAIGRLGCLCAGCDYGARAAAPAWYTLTFTHPLSKVPPDLHGLPLLPSQPLMALGLLLAFAITYGLRKRLTPWPGALCLLALSIEPPIRFLIEYTRGDPDRGFVGPLSTSQFLAALATPIFLALFIWRVRRPGLTTTAPASTLPAFDRAPQARARP